MGERTGCDLNPAQKHALASATALSCSVRFVTSSSAVTVGWMTLSSELFGRLLRSCVGQLLLVLVARSPDATLVSRHRSPMTSRTQRAREDKGQVLGATHCQANGSVTGPQASSAGRWRVPFPLLGRAIRPSLKSLASGRENSTSGLSGSWMTHPHPYPTPISSISIRVQTLQSHQHANWTRFVF